MGQQARRTLRAVSHSASLHALAIGVRTRTVSSSPARTLLQRCRWTHRSHGASRSKRLRTLRLLVDAATWSVRRPLERVGRPTSSHAHASAGAAQACRSSWHARARARSLSRACGHHPESEANTVGSALAAGAGAVGTSAHVMRADRTHQSVPRRRGSTVVGARCEPRVDIGWLPCRALGAIR